MPDDDDPLCVCASSGPKVRLHTIIKALVLLRKKTLLHPSRVLQEEWAALRPIFWEECSSICAGCRCRATALVFSPRQHAIVSTQRATEVARETSRDLQRLGSCFLQ